MTAGEYHFTISLDEDLYCRVHCKELPGLVLSGEDGKAVIGDIWPAILGMTRCRLPNDDELSWAKEKELGLN